MPLPGQGTKDSDLSERLLESLSHTPYACTSLKPLGDGTINVVFRGILARPLDPEQSTEAETSIQSVIVKQSLGHLASNPKIPLDASRSFFEASMLLALANFSPVAERVKVPRLYLFDREKHIHVLEDVPATVDLKSALVSPDADYRLSQTFALSVGRDVGSWIRSFHDWTSDPAEADLRAAIAGNKSMRKLKYAITYGQFIGVLEHFPDILAQGRETLETVKSSFAKEFAEPATALLNRADSQWGIVHGDFWAGNVLIPEIIECGVPFHETPPRLDIIDWELAQIGHRAYDLGQFIGDLYERKHFNNSDASLWILRGFLQGYGLVGDEYAFRTAIHAGVHLIGWYTRRAPSKPLPGTPDQARGVMTLGRDFIIKGWEKDKMWFRSSPLAPLFPD